MKAIKIYLFVLALVVIPVFMGFYIKEARSEPVDKKSQEYVYCKVGDDSFTTRPDLVFLVISNAKPSDEVQNSVVGTPVAVLMVDLDGKVHIFADKMPVCVKSNGDSV